MSDLRSPTAVPVTASMLYDAVSCLMRVQLDIHGDPSDRDAVSPFIQMLWRCGSAHEEQIVAGIGRSAVDLRAVPSRDREARTRAAMTDGAAVIVGGRISHGDLLGEPDLLLQENGSYVAGDIKSGAGTEGAGDGRRLKTSYGVQLAHYATILERSGLGIGTRAFVIDRGADRVDYDLDAPIGKTTLRALHSVMLANVRATLDGTSVSRPALASGCKLCHWRTRCRETLVGLDDLTLIPQLGRSLRDAMSDTVSTVAGLAALDIDPLRRPSGRTVIPGVGQERLARFRDRARLLVRPESDAYARAPLRLATRPRELFFDIEADPGRDRVYLHGIVERVRSADGVVTIFHGFFMDGEDDADERDAFEAAFSLLTAEPTAPVYYWSKYERTAYRALQLKYPNVCTAEDIEVLFDPVRAIDLLFDVVMPNTEWPLNDHSIKSIAKHCGFRWRDTDPSGAASIEWYDRWVRTQDPSLRQRILDYNEDDCLATAAVLDTLLVLPVRPHGT